MTPERWQQIEKIYHSALELAENERLAFLQKACAGDEALRHEVESLLRSEVSGDRFIEEPALEAAAKMMAHKKPESLLGQQLGSYQILSLLGTGGMGVVYKARDERLKRFVAIKVLPAEEVSDSERKRRFIQEARAASALNHPNIITIYDIGNQNGIDFVVMELVAGKTLNQMIPRKGLRLNETLKLAVQMADALARAHSAGIVHRDLKPTNVMVTDDGLVKVLDFGLAKLTPIESDEGRTGTTQLQTEEGAIVGTVSYMSPEQAEGRNVDARSDIFSFGSVLYEMATGQQAFHGDSKMSTLAAILNQEPKPVSQLVPGIPRDLEKIITRCLRKAPNRRWQAMPDLKVTLDELKEESDSGLLQTTEPPGVAVRGKLRWAGVLVAVAVAALGIAVWFWLIRSYPTREEAQLIAAPLTTYRGQENFPSLSPDGAQVAFQWCQEGQSCHIYIKQVGVEPPFQLTSTPMNDTSPAWSPDGRFIAFLRELEPKKWGLILIPQRGGSDRQLATWNLTKVVSDLPNGPYLAWTPDSKWLAFPYLEGNQEKTALFLISVETGEKRSLTTVPVESEADTAPAFSPDGRTLAFIRNRGIRSDLCLLRLGEGYRPQGEPERVVTGNQWNLGPVWMPNGRELVISSGTWENVTLWRMVVSNPGKPVRLSLTSDNAWAPSISRMGKRLAYGVRKYDSNIWRVDLEGPGRMPGRPVQLISSTKYEGFPAYSLDGKRIAFVSEQSGAAAVWIRDSDGRNPVQLTSSGPTDLGGPRWSPDGQSIAFFGVLEGNQDVYVVSAGGGAPRRLTTQPGYDAWPFWSRDGQWLYFKSVQHGSGEVWKIPSQGGEAIQVTRTKQGADVPQESPDGKFLYYCRGWPFAESVWKMPVEGGEETKVLDSVHPNPLWTVRQEGIYYFTAPDVKGASDLCLLEFVSGKIRRILRTERNLAGAGSVALSPDGRTILYGQTDEAGSDLMLVENFR